jgi:hypothetical protein
MNKPKKSNRNFIKPHFDEKRNAVFGLFKPFIIDAPRKK